MEAASAAKILDYTAADVRNLSIQFSVYQDREYFSWSGVFLSALMNLGSEERYDIFTEHLEIRLKGLGYRNVKDVRIGGDAGTYAGEGMSDGSVSVGGDADGCAGYGMSGGSLVIVGDTGNDAGELMSSGELRVGGKIASVSENWRGGRIYHRGRLIRGEEP